MKNLGLQLLTLSQLMAGKINPRTIQDAVVNKQMAQDIEARGIIEPMINNTNDG